jgi:glycerol kinase
VQSAQLTLSGGTSLRLAMKACSASSCRGQGQGPDVFAKTWKRQKRFSPKMNAELRSEKLGGWKEAVRKLLA